MIEMFVYDIYGLKVLSQLDLKIIPISNQNYGSYDIKIVLGAISEFDGINYKNYIYSSDFSKVIATFSPFLSFEVINGSKITIEMIDTDIDSCLKFLFGYIMGIVFIQKGLLALHGAVLETSERALVIVGKAGAGKSSLSTVLMENNGYKLLSDDVALLYKEDNGVIAQTGLPIAKLWKAGKVEIFNESEVISEVSGVKGKYIMDRKEQFCKTPVRLSCVVEVIPKSQIQQPTLKRVSSIERFAYAFSHLYMSEILTILELNQNYFLKLSDMIKNIPFYQLYRPSDSDTTREQSALIDSMIKELGYD